MVVERAGPLGGVRVEQATLVARRHRETDGRCQALAQWASGDLHTRGVPELRMSGSLGSPGAQRFDVGEVQTETAEVELDVQSQAAVAAGQDETIAAQPMGVAGVVPHGPLKQGV